MPRIEPRFVFRGNAAGAAGRLVKNASGETINYVVPVQGASCLPVIGGTSDSRAGEGRFVPPGSDRPFLSFASSATSAVSDPNGPGRVYTTIVKTHVEKADVLGRITFDAIAIQLTSNFGVKDTSPRIVPDEAVLEGLRLDGSLLKVVLDLKVFQKCPTKQALLDFYSKNAAFREKNGWRLSADSAKRLRPPEAKGMIIGTIVQSISWVDSPVDGVEIDGNVLRWKGVGNIYLGEILISDVERRITMARLQLGAPPPPPSNPAPKMRVLRLSGAEGGDQSQGDAAFGEVQTNGTTIP